MFFVLFLKFIKSKILKKWIFNKLTIDHFRTKKKKTVTFAVKNLLMTNLKNTSIKYLNLVFKLITNPLLNPTLSII